ncbi:MAG: hypothetical protein CMG01_05455 [Candidatus Marinimicrobia bacterium]|nr:hypothetical protein [Candidatus Neomarinimicrobiota bacterium]
MSFLASIYLWLLPATLIPIIFHFLKKRNLRNLRFSTTRFLVDMKEDSLKKINLINIILLIVRTLIILFLILMISKPIFSFQNRNIVNGEETVFYIVVDDSYSNSKFLNDNFKSLLNEIINNYTPETNILIKGLSGEIYSDLQSLQDFNKNQKFNFKKYGIYNFDNTFIPVTDKFENFLNKDLYIISDLHSSLINREVNMDGWNIFIFEHNTLNHPIIINNLYIKDNIITNNEIVSISLNAINLSNESYQDIDISLFINNIKVSDSNTSFSNNESKTINFNTSFPDKGIYNCYFSVNDYKYYFNINIDTKKTIALIYDNVESIKYIDNALIAYNEIYENLQIDKFVTNNFISSTDNYDSIVIFGSEYLTDDIVSNILYKTSNVLLIPNNTLNLYPFSKYFNDIKKENLNPQKSMISNKMNRKYKNDSFLDNIFNKSTTDIQINNYFNLNISDNSILFLDSQNSMLDKYNSNNNNLYVLPIPLDIKSSNLPVSGSFIPLLNYLLRLNDFNYYNYIDDLIVIDDSYKEFSFNININEKLYQYTNGYFIDNSLYADKPGFHKVFVNDIKLNDFAVNIKNSELIPQKLNKDSINIFFNNPLIVDSFSDFNNKLNSLISGIYLWKYFLYVVLILIIIEMYISNIYLYKTND